MSCAIDDGDRRYRLRCAVVTRQWRHATNSVMRQPRHWITNDETRRDCDNTVNLTEVPMDKAVREIRAEDINPRFNWGRALPALGIMGVDFEERVDYRRLHR